MLLIILLIVVLLLCLKVAMNRIEYTGIEYIGMEYTGMEGFRESMKPRDKPKKKGLICYYGGAFREGGNLSTLQDTAKGYDSQYYATQTHMKLKDSLNKKGYDIDTMINTRSTMYKNDLYKWYNPFNALFNNIDKKVNGKNIMIKNAVYNINNLNKDDYDFILFLRIDLFLKPDFFNILNIESEKINFIANNYDTNTCITHSKTKDPVVVDLILFVPKKYFYILDQNFKLEHDSWSYYKKMYKLSDNDLSFMTNEIFDSNSYRDINNYYLMGSRKENTKKHNDIKASNYSYENNLYNNKHCKKYNDYNEKHLSNPSEFYFNKHIDFYTIDQDDK